jgi:uncharacterized protein (DUF1697 family)
MKTYILLLRGINVSGKNILKMEDLRKMMIQLGLSQVKTYIQSGNVVFQCDIIDLQNLEQIIQNQIEKDFQIQVKLQVLTPQQLEEAIKNNPFLKDENLDLKHHYFVFLEQEPDLKKLTDFLNLDWNGERISYSSKVIFIHYFKGAGQSNLTTNLIEQKLKVGSTMRNLNTTRKILEMANT